MAALKRVEAIVQAAEADPVALSRAATVREAEADPVEAAFVREAEAGPVVAATVREAEADPVEGRADSAEAGRATIAAERFAASALTRSNTLTTRM